MMRAIRAWKFLHLFHWICSYILKNHAKQTIIFLFACGGAVFAQLASFLTAAYYARMLQTNTTITKFGLELYARSSPELLVTVTVMVMLGLIASAALHYLSNRMALQLSFDFEKDCINQTIKIAENLPVWGSKETVVLNDIHDNPGIMAKDATICGRVLRIFIMLLFPALISCIGLLILLKLNMKLSLILLALAPGFMYLYLKSSRAAVKNAFAIERDKKDFNKILKGIVTSEDVADAYTRQKDIMSHSLMIRQRPYFARILAVQNIRFLTQAAIAVALCSVLIYYGMSSILGSVQLLNLLFYILVLRYIAGQLIGVFSGLSSFASLYPSVVRFYQATKSFSDALTYSGDKKNTQAVTIRYFNIEKNKVKCLAINPSSETVLLGFGKCRRSNLIPVAAATRGGFPVFWSERNDYVNIESLGNEKKCENGHAYGSYIYIDLEAPLKKEKILGKYKNSVALFHDGKVLKGASMGFVLQNPDDLKQKVGKISQQKIICDEDDDYDDNEAA